MRIVAGVATDVGRVREGNEDAFVVEPPLYAVADGMGGARAGEVASQLALATITEMQKAGTASLEDEVREANRIVFARAGEDERYAGMGTTLTAVLASPEAIHLAHVGDSRAYLLRAGALRQLTRDHTLVERMVQAGEITPTEADVHPHRNVLLRALGTEPKVEVDADDVGLLEGDRILLCSDGLTTMVAEDQILTILGATVGQPQDAADRLVRAANRAGGIDNTTVIVLDVEAGDPDQGTVAAAPAPAPTTTRPKRRLWPWLVGAIAGVLLLTVAYTAFRSYVDNQWYVGVSNGHVAIYQGIPASPFGFELSHVDQDTGLDAAAVEQLATFPGLSDGINVDSREAALATVDQMRQDLRDARRQQDGGTP
jgi:serine/threonine protein phosphatase PrpC